jgi:hypothetical protein
VNLLLVATALATHAQQCTAATCAAAAGQTDLPALRMKYMLKEAVTQGHSCVLLHFSSECKTCTYVSDSAFCALLFQAKNAAAIFLQMRD